MIDTVLFDLDGTLLPMDQDVFVETYMGLLAAKIAPYGYEPKRFAKTVWAGTRAMVLNTGDRNNEKAFWDTMVQEYGPGILDTIPLFDEFYASEFGQVRTVCGFNPQAAEVIAMLKEMGVACVLATNPLFPATATYQRTRWAGLDPGDFALITTYENSSHCKPNPDYYRQILKKIDKTPEQCIMVGNDVTEDMLTCKLGMKVFLLTDCLINKQETDISRYPNGNFEELKAFLKENL